MLKNKAIATFGATLVTASLLAGVTYAWFTSTKTSTPSKITAGKLGIEFQVTDPDESPVPLYPQLTVDGMPDPNGNPSDIAFRQFTLENDSDRQVLVKVSGAGMTVTGEGNEEIEDTDAVRFHYDLDNSNALYTMIGKDVYIYLPVNRTETLDVQVWIDGETGHNEYQNAVIDFNEMTAKAVQYRKAAVVSELGVTAEQAEALASGFGVTYE